MGSFLESGWGLLARRQLVPAGRERRNRLGWPTRQLEAPRDAVPEEEAPEEPRQPASHQHEQLTDQQRIQGAERTNANGVIEMNREAASDEETSQQQQQ